jgi:hypothetical protein
MDVPKMSAPHLLEARPEDQLPAATGDICPVVHKWYPRIRKWFQKRRA